MSDDTSRQSALTRVARAARLAQGRMRFVAALEASVSTFAVALVAVAGALTLYKVVPGFSARMAIDVMIAAALATLGAGIYAASRRLPKLAGAMALDAHHGLSDRLASALAFSELGPAERTRLMELAIDDACEKAKGLSPRRAVPLRSPRDLGAMLGLLGGVVLLAVLRPYVPAQVSRAKTIEPVVLAADDIDLFREVGHELAAKDKDRKVLEALKAYNQLVEDIAQKRLERDEAFRRLAELQEHLAEEGALDPKTLEEQLKTRAKELKNSALSKPLADALDQADLAKAEEKMRELAKQLRDNPNGIDRAELERLRQAMKKAAEGQAERLAALEQRREELQQDLLRKKEQLGDGGGGSDEERSLLDKKQRELERLDRENGEKSGGPGRQLDKLDRDLAQAAEDLMREMGMSANDLDQGAEDLNRMAQQKMSEQEREELRQKLEELREQLRQSGQGGRERMARLRRFMRQARGQGQGQGKSSHGNCAPGDANCQEGKEQGGEGEEGESQSESQNEGASLSPSGGQGKNGEIMLGLSQGQSQSGPAPSGGDPGGEPGENQGGDLKGNQSKGSKGTSTIDVHAAGLDTGQGPTRSQVILGASEKGFRGGAYKKVYTEYRTSAEEQLHEDKIPPGGSQHIRRYFDLIRPRE